MKRGLRSGLTVIAVGIIAMTALHQLARAGDNPLSAYWTPSISRWSNIIELYASQRGIDPNFVAAIITEESKGNPNTVSLAGAVGLMQVMPFWLKIIGKPGDSLFRIRTNLRLGCTILKYYLDKEKGNLQAALKRYNGTTEREYAMRVDKVLRTRWFRQ